MNFEEIYNILKKNNIITLIIDFDHTITTFDSQTSIGVFSKLLNNEYREKKKIIDLKVSSCNNTFYMKLLWFRKICLLKKCKAKSYIEKASKHFRVNSNFIKLFDYCKKNNIKIIICSSGYKPLIKTILNKNDIDDIEVIGNENIFKIITPLNKSKYIKTKIKNSIVIGDTIADINRIKNKCITVGICNDLSEYDTLKQNFDYVVLWNVSILKNYRTSKSKIGICFYNKQKYFFKSINEKDNEILKYQQIKKYFNVSNIAVQYKKYIIYQYILDFKNKTINDYLYGLEKSINISSITNQYQNSINNTLIQKDEQECESTKYFFDRTYLIKEYVKNLDYKNLIINEKYYNIRDILKSIISNIEKSKKIFSFISQGDPTDTNITTTGFFTDFENSGYNSLIGEFAIIFVSLFSHGRYFYPKYNRKAYVINNKIINKYDKYKIDINYYINNKNIYIKNFSINLPEKNKKLILNFIDLYIYNSNYSKYLSDFFLIKYYICMRLLTPININLMDENDRVIIFTLLVYIYDNVNDLYSLKELIGGNNGNI